MSEPLKPLFELVREWLDVYGEYGDVRGAYLASQLEAQLRAWDEELRAWIKMADPEDVAERLLGVPPK